MISTRSSSDGNGTQSLNRKRSSCASGRGYVPSISSGFCVASTKNGGSSWCRSRATETCCSCIASSSADCVLGVARLISSASSRLAKTGPGWNRNCALAVLLDEDVGADDVGRHQVRRELDAVERAVDDVRDGSHEHRLAQARHALEQRVAVGDEADQRLPDEVVLADDDRLDLATRSLGRGRRTPRRRAQLGRRSLERRLGHRLSYSWTGLSDAK